MIFNDFFQSSRIGGAEKEEIDFVAHYIKALPQWTGTRELSPSSAGRLISLESLAQPPPYGLPQNGTA